MLLNPQSPADLVTFTEEIFNGKPHFCAVKFLNPFHATGLFLDIPIQFIATHCVRI